MSVFIWGNKRSERLICSQIALENNATVNPQSWWVLPSAASPASPMDLWHLLIPVSALCSFSAAGHVSNPTRFAHREVPQYPHKLWQIFTHQKCYQPSPKHSVYVCLVIYCILSFNCGLGKALQKPQRWAVNLLHPQLSVESSHIYNIQKR